MQMIDRLLDPGQNSFFLFGPRGTGKSTWIKKQYYAHAVYIDLLDPEQYRLFTARPERLIEVIEGNPGKRIIIIDEIQKVPQLLDVVHQQIESRGSLKFVLTGSSSRKLKRAGVDLLAGRAELKTMHPFMASELEDHFNLRKALDEGLLPLVYSKDNAAEILKSYGALYIREEVQMEGLVRNIGDFSRFLEAISFSHGSCLNSSEVARDCQVNRKTVEGYISILEDLLLSIRLPVFTKRAKRHMINHPKFYFFDAGVFKSFRPKGPLDYPEEIDGPALEGLILQHLRAFNAYSSNGNDLFFWRTKSGVEVDFIIYGPDDFTAIEVKNSQTIRRKDLKGLRSFKEDYPKAELLLLYRGKDRLKIQDVLCVPCEEFLRGLKPGRKNIQKVLSDL